MTTKALPQSARRRSQIAEKNTVAAPIALSKRHF